MPLKKNKAPVVQAGEVRTIIATGIVAIDKGDGFFQVTTCCDQKWGTDDVQEREITGRLMLTRSAWRELIAAARGAGMDASDMELVAAPVH